MYFKLSKYYKSNKSCSFSVDIEYLESIAEEIRLIIVGNRGLTINEYLKKATTIPLIELGHRRIHTIKNESKLEAYFPSVVWKVLRDRCERVKSSRLTDHDVWFIMENRCKGYKWLSEKMYMTPSNIARKAKQFNIEIDKEDNKYDAETMKFISDNADKGAEWIGMQLKISPDSIRHKCQRDGITLKGNKLHKYTAEENKLIKTECYKGAEYFSKLFNVTPAAIKRHAVRLGVRKFT